MNQGLRSAKTPLPVDDANFGSELARRSKLFWAWIKAHLLVSVFVVLGLVTLVVAYFESIVEKGATGSNINGFGDSLWWAVVTLLTVGYGDRYPVTTGGRLLAVVLMFSGVISVAILTSKIASVFLEQVLLEGRGMVKTSSLNDHFIICGWRRDMPELLNHVLSFNPGLKPQDVLVVTSVTLTEIHDLQGIEPLGQVQFIHGDYTQESVLRRSAPERARKIMILADQTPSSAGALASVTETDARTIMTAMTLSHIARGTAVTAEILDPNMDQYLRMAHVTEIIYSREYSRLLLGNASSGMGISNIIFDLLDPGTPTRIQTLSVPEALVGRKYSELCDWIKQHHPACVVIGVLENTGNSYRIKEQALRKAQKTPDIQKLVNNLKSVKDIKYNNPLFNPSSDLVIQEGVMAIIVGSSQRVEGAVGSTQAVA